MGTASGNENWAKQGLTRITARGPVAGTRHTFFAGTNPGASNERPNLQIIIIPYDGCWQVSPGAMKYVITDSMKKLAAPKKNFMEM